MTEREEEARDELVTEQRSFNRTTWQRLREHGVRDEDRMVLQFSYWAPDCRHAEELLKHLIGEGVARMSPSDGDEWLVSGATAPVSVTLAFLGDWVTRMIDLGLSVGCVFDGWGTETPARSSG